MQNLIRKIKGQSTAKKGYRNLAPMVTTNSPPRFMKNEGTSVVAYKVFHGLSRHEENDLKVKILQGHRSEKGIAIYSSDGSLWYKLTADQVKSALKVMGP